MTTHRSRSIAPMAAAAAAVGSMLVTAPTATAAPTCANGGTCVVGDTGPGGGIVFFVKGTGPFSAQAGGDTVSLTGPEQDALPFEYLEAAPAVDEVTVPWGNVGPITTATARLIGTGSANTELIVTASPGDTSATVGAYVAADYAGGGLSDWFMPSRDELTLMGIVQQSTPLTALALPPLMWSSTERNGSSAYVVFTTGVFGFSNIKAVSYTVRPVRAFSALPPTPVPVPPVLPPASEPPPTPTPAPPPPPPVPPVPTALGVRGTGGPPIPATVDEAGTSNPDLALADPLISSAIAVGGTDSIAVSVSGAVFPTNAAHDFGSLPVQTRLRAPVVNLAVHWALTGRTGDAAGTWVPGGYWLVGADGGVFAFGDAPFLGSASGQRLTAPITAIAPTPTGAGYWLVGADGAVLAFGDAADHGTLAGVRLSRPVVALAPTPGGDGYWMVGADGGVFAFGGAPFLGSAVSSGQRFAGIIPTVAGRGYWLVTTTGEVVAFGDAVA